MKAQSGVPFTPRIEGDPLAMKGRDAVDFPQRNAACSSLTNPGNPDNYLKKECFTLPTAFADIAAKCVPFGSIAGTCKNLRGNLGRNVVEGPGLLTWDFSVFKNNQISENLNAQFRLEIFNILDRTNYGHPDEDLFNANGAPLASGGEITSAQGTGRQIQFALKLIW